MQMLHYVDDRTSLEHIRGKYIRKGNFICQGYNDEIIEITNDHQIEEIIKDIMEHDIGYNVSDSYEELDYTRENY